MVSSRAVPAGDVGLPTAPVWVEDATPSAPVGLRADGWPGTARAPAPSGRTAIVSAGSGVAGPVRAESTPPRSRAAGREREWPQRPSSGGRAGPTDRSPLAAVQPSSAPLRPKTRPGAIHAQIGRTPSFGRIMIPRPPFRGDRRAGRCARLRTPTTGPSQGPGPDSQRNSLTIQGLRRASSSRAMRPSNAAGASGISRAHRPIPDPLDPDKANSSTGRPGRPVAGPPPWVLPRGSESRPARNGEGPARETSCSPRPGPCGRSTDRRAESEAGDLVEVGDQVRLLILLDRPSAPG